MEKAKIVKNRNTQLKYLNTNGMALTPQQAREMAKKADQEAMGQMKTQEDLTPEQKQAKENLAKMSADTNKKILENERAIANLMSASIAISAAGGVAGAVYAIKKKKSGWSVVGWFLLGSIIASIPTGLVVRAKMINHTAKIKELQF